MYEANRVFRFLLVRIFLNEQQGCGEGGGRRLDGTMMTPQDGKRLRKFYSRGTHLNHHPK